jgi:hypothetical protein
MKKQEKNLLWGALLVGGAYWFWMKREEEADVGFYGDYDGRVRDWLASKPFGGSRGGKISTARRKSLQRRLQRINQRLAKTPHDAPMRKRLVARKRGIQTKLVKLGVTFRRRSDSIAAEDAAEMAGYIHEVQATAADDLWRYG